jgi:hypothetical protein
MKKAKGRRAWDEIAYIPEESVELQGLGQVNRSLVQELGSRCAEQGIATVDQDATIIESWKQEALRTYEGERAISRCWPCGQRRTWCQQINFETRMCRR